jgi:hypothetical protein
MRESMALYRLWKQRVVINRCVFAGGSREGGIGDTRFSIPVEEPHLADHYSVFGRGNLANNLVRANNRMLSRGIQQWCPMK